GDATGSTPPSDVARAEGLASIAVGSNAYAKGTSSTAVGVQAYTSAADAVALGSGSVANTANTVSVGNDGTSSYTAYDAQGVAYTIKNQANTRRLVNMAAGQNDTDAVNVGQLKGVTAAIGGGAAVGPDGKVVAPTFEVNGQNYDTIADAINAAAVSGGGTDANAVAYDSTAKTKVTLGGGTAGTTIANVKAGAADMDAVNLAQLKAAGLSVDTAGKVTNSFVAYDSTAMGKVTLGGGTAGTTIANVKAGTTATDAVNLGQLTAAGLTVDTNGKATNAFVAYDTTAKGKITLGGGSAGTTIANVKAGAADMDAVNLAQLKAAGFNVDTNGNATNAFVAYDTTAKTGVTLGSGSAGAQIHNLVAGTTATDAVNLAQLTAAGLNVDTAGNATNSFVAYDSTAMDKVTLGGGAAGTTITNVKAGTTATDAVNFSQLKPVVDALGGGAAISAAGVVTGPTYSINNHKSYNVGDAFKDVDQGLSDLNSAVAAITADTGGAGLVAQDATTRNITVGKMTDGTVVDMTNSSGVQRTITGVAAGAVNSSSFDAINGSQLAGVSSSFATAIGGGAMMNPDGSITQPSFSVGGDTVHNVGDAITNLDGRVTSNTDSLVNLQTTVNNITNGGGIANPNAVAYDSSAHDQITLAGNGTAGTKLTGLAAGDISSADSTDAVTGGQLYATNAEVAALQNTVQNFNTTGTAGIGINGKDGKDGAPAAAASANGSDAIAMGDNASASGDHAIVIGGGATGTNDGVIAIGGNAGASGKDSIAIGNGASAPADNAVALGAHSVADRDNTVSVGSAGNERQITNVAAGTQGTDAVNLNQMNSAVGGIARKAYSGIAAATALTMIPDVDANKTLSIGIGGGTFQGYAATAIGGTARITQNIKVRVGAGWSAAGTTVGAGASYQW
ncbi:YadA-like family protein, partial [Caballeronia sordidicola]|uniref:YadA-like family protein n=1 Tax=Caballeronia sordidicola TaxID=196367 RepID=UPI00076499EB